MSQNGTSAGWAINIERIGNEQQPVIIIDGFAPNPSRFVDDASFLSFRQMGEHYPGIRATVAPVMMRDLLAALAPVANQVFGGTGFDVVDAFYSLVTTQPADLAPIQRLPHFDGVEPERLALLHYLSTDERGGTAFYRHRQTGFETVDAGRLAAYRAALETDLRNAGLPDPAYIDGDTALFAQSAAFTGRFNRAILYPSNTLHCARIPANMALSSNPATGRLTVNTFLATR